MNLSKYFQKRQKTYPQNVKGRFRRIKNFTNFICLAVFFLVPFLRWERGVGNVNQAVLIDIANSRGYFFFIQMWPEEVYYLAAILIFAAVLLFFITSLFGRVWCGYSCPQTVWTDIFIKIERFFQGDRNERIKLDRKTFSWQNIYKKFATHFSWLLISILTGLGFVNYFNDAPTIIKNLLNFNIEWLVCSWVLGVALATYVMAGFAREQVCNYMCPYARFQSAMFDKNTLIISYDNKRGEQRGKHKKGDSFENRGHCIECRQCVVVCPQNIDIRNGLQMECIACGLCIDACDNVMDQVGLPRGLIGYSTEFKISNQQNSKVLNLFTARTFYYGTILLIVGSFIIFNLTFKSNLQADVLPDRNPLYVMLSNGDIRNGYTVKISNKTFTDKFYAVKISGINYSSIKTEANSDININSLKVKAGQVENFKIYLTVANENLEHQNAQLHDNKVKKKESNKGEKEILFTVSDNQENQEKKSVVVKSVFISQ